MSKSIFFRVFYVLVFFSIFCFVGAGATEKHSGILLPEANTIVERKTEMSEDNNSPVMKSDSSNKDSEEWVMLFEDETWNKFSPDEIKEFKGVVEYIPPQNKFSFGRFNPYKLRFPIEKGIDGAFGTECDIYTGSSNVLKPYIGKNVVIAGKYVTMHVEGSFTREIWPVKIKLIK